MSFSSSASADNPKPPARRSTWSLISIGCPVMAVGSAFGSSAAMADDGDAMRIVLTLWLVLGLIVVVACALAFLQKERARWLSIVSLLLMLGIVFGGI